MWLLHYWEWLDQILLLTEHVLHLYNQAAVSRNELALVINIY